MKMLVKYDYVRLTKINSVQELFTKEYQIPHCA